jgi:hypothetical protein
MAAYGIPEEEMVKLILNPKTNAPITPKTLRARFRDELDRGMVNANVRVMNGMFKNATTPTKVNPGGNPILQIFWSKVRMGWKQDGPGPRVGDDGNLLPGAGEGEVNMLEAARRLAFTITMGALQAAKEGKPAPKAPAAAKKAVRA